MEKEYKYTVYARRNTKEIWTIWLNTYDFPTMINAVKTISGYGWLSEVYYKFEEIGG